MFLVVVFPFQCYDNSKDIEVTSVPTNICVDKEDVIDIYIMEHYSLIKSTEYLPLATTYMRLEDIEDVLLSEMSQRKTDTL